MRAAAPAHPRPASPVLLAASLWRYRAFIGSLVARDFRGRYLRTALGGFWALAQPLVMVLLYLLVFSELMRARLPGSGDALAYGLFLCGGLLPWTFFSEVLIRCQGVFVEHGDLLKKSAFPRSALPVYAALSAALNFGLATGVFLAVAAAAGRWPGRAVAAWLPLALLLGLLGMALGVILGTLHVYLRDVAHATAVALQVGFWLTPIVYPVEALPEAVRPWIARNPLAPLVGAFQQVVLRGDWPAWASLAPLGLAALVSAGAAYLLFRRLGAEMADVL